MGRFTNQLKESAERALERYDEEQLNDLLTEAEDELINDLPPYELKELITNTREDLEGYEVQDITEDMWRDALYHYYDKPDPYIEDIWVGTFQSHSFPDPDEWAFDEAQGQYEDYMDSKYQEWKDER